VLRGFFLVVADILYKGVQFGSGGIPILGIKLSFWLGDWGVHFVAGSCLSMCCRRLVEILKSVTPMRLFDEAIF
jgi:hypothetical protein